MSEYLMFPIANEHGFKVDSAENYEHMVKTIIESHIELALEYPGDHIFVVYTVDE